MVRLRNVHTAALDACEPGSVAEWDDANPAVCAWRSAGMLVDESTPLPSGLPVAASLDRLALTEARARIDELEASLAVAQARIAELEAQSVAPAGESRRARR